MSIKQNIKTGFPKSIFQNPINPDFLCSLCNNVVRSPCECSSCGSLFCSNCINQNNENSNDNKKYDKCPLCNETQISFHPIGKVIRNILSSLEVKCPNEDCLKIMSLEKYELHESICGLPKCQNQKCLKRTEKQILYNDNNGNEYKFCSEMCKYSFIFQEKVKNNTDINELCNWFHNFLSNTLEINIHKKCIKRIDNLKNIIRAISGDSQVQINDLDYAPGLTEFKWDTINKGQGIQVYNNGESIFLNESCYAFKSIVSNIPFTSGIHYFEIIADRRTENELKIGVTKNLNFNYDTSFCDYDFGWAFYGIGQLRHGNNATGEIYGKKFKKNGVLGVFLDMNKGILSFGLDGEYLGVAFRDEELKGGNIYAAVSLLHIGGCTVQSNVPAPPYFFNEC